MQHMADTVKQWLELQRVLTAGGGGTLSICSLLITTGEVEFHQMQMLISEHLSLWCNDYWCLDAKHHTGGLKHALPPSSNSMPLPLLWSWSIDNPAHAEQCFVALFNEYNLPELIFWIPEFQSIIKCHQYSINACNVTICKYSGTTDLKSSYVLAACRWVPESFLVVVTVLLVIFILLFGGL